MQFYIIHKNPLDNAALLPDYALKSVNLREGWQILSDIGHLFEVYWPGQNNAYSPFHAVTRKFWQNQHQFNFFIQHYQCCLSEYQTRFGKTLTFHERMDNFNQTARSSLLENIPKAYTLEQQDAFYLLKQKKQHLNSQEIERLEKLLTTAN